MNNHLSKLFIAFLGFVAGVAFLINCGGSDGGSVSVVDADVTQINSAVLKDANGVYVGRVIGMEHSSAPYVLTDQGYRTGMLMGLGRIFEFGEVYFESVDCTGTAYVASLKNLGTVYIPNNVLGDLAYTAGAIFYTPHDAQSVTINIQSMYDFNMNCVPHIATDDTAYPAYANDPSITGIQSSLYLTRMLIE